MDWDHYLLGLSALAGLLFCSSLAALRWAVKTGQWRNLDRGARVIFTEDEPEGVPQPLQPPRR
jgi:nitrogen fixation-related uncharacterized protein